MPTTQLSLKYQNYYFLWGCSSVSSRWLLSSYLACWIAKRERVKLLGFELANIKMINFFSPHILAIFFHICPRVFSLKVLEKAFHIIPQITITLRRHAWNEKVSLPKSCSCWIFRLKFCFGMRNCSREWATQTLVFLNQKKVYKIFQFIQSMGFSLSLDQVFLQAAASSGKLGENFNYSFDDGSKSSPPIYYRTLWWAERWKWIVWGEWEF